MIKHKPKPCKGTGKAKGYGCGKLTIHRVYGLGKMCCYANWLYTSENGKIILEKAMLKASKPRRELEKVKKEYNNRKSLPKSLKQAQIVFNKYVRLRDRGKPCISSDIAWKNDFDAGHLFPVKQFSELRFDEDNVHGQSIGDNRFKEGNFQEYLIRVEKRIGKERLDSLIKRAENSKKRVYKWSVSEVEEIKKKYQNKIKEL